MDDNSAKSLAAAVIRVAVEDLQSLHKKVMHVKSLDKQGKLAEAIKRQTNSARFVFTADEIGAIDFLEKKTPEVYFALTDVYELPETINKQIAYCRENIIGVQARVRYFKGQATKAKKNLSL